MKEYGVFVSFCGGVRGLAPLPELGLEAGQDPAAHFAPGKVRAAGIFLVYGFHPHNVWQSTLQAALLRAALCTLNDPAFPKGRGQERNAPSRTEWLLFYIPGGATFAALKAAVAIITLPMKPMPAIFAGFPFCSHTSTTAN